MDVQESPLVSNLLALFSSIQGLELGEGRSAGDVDLSLWMPVAPPGYLALGCVAHKGSQPPPNHIVHCIRSDLATSTTYSECVLSTSPNSCFTNGFSIWQLDNILGSFYAHPTSEYPLKDSCYDLNHLPLWNSSWHYFSSKEPTSTETGQHENASQQSSNRSASSSDGMFSVLFLKKPTTICQLQTSRESGGIRVVTSVGRSLYGDLYHGLVMVYSVTALLKG